MATRKVRKPTALKMPKRPKASASIAVWERFDQRCKDVEKQNAAKLAAYKKSLSRIEADKKRKEAIIKKHSGRK